MGAPRVFDTEDVDDPWLTEWLAHGGDPTEPWESNTEGCPGSWIRTEFWESVYPYVRPRSGDGVYSENLRLSRSRDPLVLQATQYYEQEQSRSTSDYQARSAALMQARANAHK